MKHRRPRLRLEPGPFVFAVASLGTILGLPVTAGAAEADDPTPPAVEVRVRPTGAQAVTGRYLHITSTTAPGFLHLEPGATAVWDLGVAVDAPEAGEVLRSLRATGDLAEIPGALSIAVWSCDRPTMQGSCEEGSELVMGPTPITDLTEAAVDLGRQGSEAEEWLTVHVMVSPDLDPELDGRATLIFGASGTSTTGPASTSPGRWAGLAHTGAQLGPMVLLAVGSVVTGLVLAGVARRRRVEALS